MTEATPGVSLEISLPDDARAVAEFTQRVASALGLGKTCSPTKIADAEGNDCRVHWFADGWTPEGISITLLASPDRVELAFGAALREQPFGVALRDLFRGGDQRVESLDLDDWERRLRAAVDAALKSSR